LILIRQRNLVQLKISLSL